MKKIIAILCLITSFSFGATRDVVPRATGEGNLGTSALKWSSVNVVTSFVGTITQNGTNIPAFASALTNGSVIVAQVSSGSTSLVGAVSLPLVNQISNVWISSTGNVGVGLTNNTANLAVTASAPTLKIRTTGAGTTASPISRKLMWGNYLDVEVGSVNLLDHSGSEARADMAFSMNHSDGNLYEDMRLRNGNLGIGTNNPGYKLHVAGDTMMTNLYVSGVVSQSSVSANVFMGQVGINTNSPGYMLDVLCDAANSINIDSVNHNNFGIRLGKGTRGYIGTADWCMNGTTSASNLAITAANPGALVLGVHSGNEAMRIIDNKNVGVQTTNPSCAFQVNGAIGWVPISAPTAVAGAIYYEVTKSNWLGCTNGSTWTVIKL